ncbi:MAG TPA: type I methionyl aminopeptidase [Candidatus Limnocylindria bacterium]|nr:type I methionyl aminopeptidase [Candidatus Limnocylindria bacterium]
MQIKVKTPAEIKAMRESGRLLATVLATLKQAVQPGLTTKDLAEIAKRELRGTGGQPTFLGQYGFPEVICISLNDEIVHGIPSAKREIRQGDIVSLDFGVTYDGMITDSAISTVAGGAKNEKVIKLLQDTQASLYAGIATLRNGVRVGDISSAIQQVLDAGGYGVVRDMVGHGVGHQLHEEPDIPNYGRKGTGPALSTGMTIAIEPMATLGDFRVFIDVDGWTVRSNDRSLAAHFEHTILITQDGSEILTKL